MSYRDRDNFAFASVAALRAAVALAPDDADDLIITNPEAGLATFAFYIYDRDREIGEGEGGPISTVTIDYLGEVTGDVPAASTTTNGRNANG